MIAATDSILDCVIALARAAMALSSCETAVSLVSAMDSVRSDSETVSALVVDAPAAAAYDVC